MYKCTECGLEFKIKPEYCDCGNNEFVLKGEDDITQTTAYSVSETVSENKSDINDIKPDYENMSISGKKAGLSLPCSPYALFFLFACVILSLLIIFAWNPINNTENTVKQNQEAVVNSVIPSIEKLWKESSVIPTVNTVKPASKTIEVHKKQDIKPVNTTKVNVQTAKAKQVPQAKINSLGNSKPVANASVNKTQNVQQAFDSSAQKTVDEAKRKAEKEALAAAEKARNTALAKQELASYKINLRNEIGKKIDFTKVIGDGDCVISFSVNSSGRLINRAFTIQSTNITLNNAVYNAVLATPSYNPPPSAYNNETFKLNIKFTNGNFAITLE